MFTSTTINLTDIKKEDLDKYVFVDIREPIEVMVDPVPQLTCVELPLSGYGQSGFQFEEDRQYILFCSKGMRSQMLAEQLHSQGIKNAASLNGGTDAIKSYFRT